MKIEFTCECGERLSSVTSSEKARLDARLRCDTCKAVYAVTITQFESFTRRT